MAKAFARKGFIAFVAEYRRGIILDRQDVPDITLYIDPQMKHGLDKVNGPGFKSDFGTGYQTRDEVWRYITIRAACFFQDIMNGVTTAGATGNSVFIDCMNNRGGCSSASNPPVCPVPPMYNCN